MKARRTHIRKFLLLVTLLACSLAIVLPLSAAYEVERPIANGQVNQGFLYGENSEFGRHYGVDFAYPLGTPVNAVSSGYVVRLVENIPDHTGDGWGNYVLLRHDRRSWDADRGVNSYVFSIYAHLAQWSVIPEPGAYVTAGTQIAQVDDTGTTCRDVPPWCNHLHFQMALHDDPNWSMSGANQVSRNPELWLQPYIQNSTGIVVGKLTDAGGTPIGNDSQLRGLSKPYGGYLWSTTYTSIVPELNPDDVLFENWATTDVSPNPSYSLQYCNSSGGNCQPYGDRSTYAVAAGEVTYVNLYPFSLPDVGAYSGWSVEFKSLIGVRNHSLVRTNAVYSTYFDSVAWGMGQGSYLLPTINQTAFNPPGASWHGEAMLVGSALTGAVVVNQSGYETYAYTGIPILSDFGLAQAKTLYIPNYANNYWGWRTKVLVQNTGRAQTNIIASYYGISGGSTPACQKTYDYVDPLERVEIKPEDCTVPNPPPSAGSLHLSTVGSGNQPIAAVVIQYVNSTDGGPRKSAISAFSNGGSTIYMPDLLRNFVGAWNSGYWVHNTRSTATGNITIGYYKRDGTLICTEPQFTLAANGTKEFYQGTTDCNLSCLCNYSWSDWRDGMFSASISAGGSDRIIGSVHQDNYSGDDFQSYNAFVASKSRLVVSHLVRSSIWDASLVVQNAGTAVNYYSVYFYHQNGSPGPSLINRRLEPRGYEELRDYIPSPFQGSVLIVAGSPVVASVKQLRLNLAGWSDAASAYEALGEQ